MQNRLALARIVSAASNWCHEYALLCNSWCRGAPDNRAPLLHHSTVNMQKYCLLLTHHTALFIRLVYCLCLIESIEPRVHPANPWTPLLISSQPSFLSVSWQVSFYLPCYFYVLST